MTCDCEGGSTSVSVAVFVTVVHLNLWKTKPNPVPCVFVVVCFFNWGSGEEGTLLAFSINMNQLSAKDNAFRTLFIAITGERGSKLQ